MTKSESKVMSEHVAFWTNQTKRGTAVVFGPVLDPKCVYGIGVVEIEDEAHLLSLLRRDPAVKAALQRDEFYSMSPRSIVCDFPLEEKRQKPRKNEDEPTLMEFTEVEIMEFLYKKYPRESN